MIRIYSEDEIRKISEACQIAARCLVVVRDSVSQGMTTEDLDVIARSFLAERKIEPAFLGYRGYPKALCVSINEEVVHGIPSKDKVIRNGDLVSLDIGTKLNGFFGDTATTVAIGEIHEDLSRLLETGRQALDIAVAEAREGNRLYDISFAIQQLAESNGYSVVREFVGHGIGANLHEEPQIPNYGAPGTGPVLKEGMVLAIEPMVNMGTFKVEVLEDNWTAVTADNKPSVHFEHTVVVRKNKGEVLTWPNQKD